jgi:protein TonB
MNTPGESFVAEDFLRTKAADVAIWAASSLMVVCGLTAGVWAYSTIEPAAEAAGEPAAAMVVEFAEFAVSPAVEELDVAEGALSMASLAAPPTELEADPDAEPIEEPEPVVEAEPAEEVDDTPEPPPEPLPEPEPEPAVLPEPVEPIIDVPEVDVPEPAVVVPSRTTPPEPTSEEEPEPEPEPVVEPDPALPMPVTMSRRVAEVRADTPPTEFKPPVRKAAPPPQQASTQTSAPKPAAQQAAQAAAPQQAPSAEPSASQVSRWESSVFRHLGQRRKFPPEARARGEKGEVVVQFTIDGAGRVQSVSVARSSGFESLDQAARALVQGASPLPAPPAGMPKSRLTISMPVDYTR